MGTDLINSVNNNNINTRAGDNDMPLDGNDQDDDAATTMTLQTAEVEEEEEEEVNEIVRRKNEMNASKSVVDPFDATNEETAVEGAPEGKEEEEATQDINNNSTNIDADNDENEEDGGEPAKGNESFEVIY